jgi:hypothetical protein
VIDELLNQQVGHETHIGKTLLEHGGRRGRTAQDFRVFAFDHRPAVLENDIRPGALRQAIGHFLANYLIRLGRQILDFRIAEQNFLHRHGVVKSQLAFIRHLCSRQPHAALIRFDRFGRRRRLIGRCNGRGEHPCQRELVGIGFA